ncbi:uncharacterized protein [Physcomitrium patens]|uniref:uncharacterized protein isoform X4 n=1 Tax=Physcomitrium patens TaxID=3218 RepID=UPI003CCE4EFD
MLPRRPKDYDEGDGERRMKKEVKVWRGVAHYRTCMKRMALQRERGARTMNDLYLLEDIVNDVRFICDLPVALRLDWQICQVLGYELHGPGHRVCKQGSKAFSFIIIFAGSVKCTYHQLGMQEDKTWIIPAGKWFGDKVLEDWNYTWEFSVDTNEKTELLTLTRRDYEKVLKIKKTPELQERVSFLKGIERFKNLPRQSLLRLANVLSHRIYSKNRSTSTLQNILVTLITFQGDDSTEMYFVRSGECRVILEVPNEKMWTPLPRASSFLKQYWPSQYHRCKMDEPKDKHKDLRHPQHEKPRDPNSTPCALPKQRPGKTTAPRSEPCHSVDSGKLVPHLSSAIVKNPDAISCLIQREMSSKHKSISAALKKRQSEITPIALAYSPEKTFDLRRRVTSGSAPDWRWSSLGSTPKDTKRKLTLMDRLPIGTIGEIRTHDLPSEERPSQWGSPRGSVEAISRSGTLVRKEKVFPLFPVVKDDQPNWPFMGTAPNSSTKSSRFSLMQIHFSDKYGEKQAKKSKYSLRLFLMDCHRKEKEHRMAEFSEKDHRLWQMGIRGEQIMPGIVGEENEYYRDKFEQWARHIIDREKTLLSHTKVADTGDWSFMPGTQQNAPMKLTKGPGKDGPAASTILDIGCLKAGDYFGERGLLTATKRAATIVTVSHVDSLVLSKWDFHRHCDRHVLRVFKSNEYQKQRHLFRNYQRNRKWERLKRRVFGDVLEGKANKLKVIVGPRPIRVLPKRNRTKHDMPVKEWIFKSHPTALPRFPQL